MQAIPNLEKKNSVRRINRSSKPFWVIICDCYLKKLKNKVKQNKNIKQPCN